MAMRKMMTILTGGGGIWHDLSALVLRVIFGSFMAFGHGLGKLQGYSERAESFSDPLGVGSPLSLALAIGAEFFCSLLLVLGLGTRFVVLPLIFTMIVAGFIIHGADPFGKKELAFVYLTAFTVILMLGPGRFSLDHLIAKRFRGK